MLHSFQVAVLSIAHQIFVELLDPHGIFRESNSVTCHGIPRSDSEDVTFVILAYKVFQNSGVIYESIELVALDSFEAFFH